MRGRLRLPRHKDARFSYDESDIHLSYTESRGLPAETTRLWMEVVSGYTPRDGVGTIVDLGCGTGRFTCALSDRFSARVLGVEPSARMLAMASKAISSPLVGLVRGGAERIPLAGGTADLVFLSMVYHHLPDKVRAMREVARVLRRQGTLCIRTATTDLLDSYLWLRFFPGARRIEFGRMPSRTDLAATVQACGLELAGHTAVRQPFAANLSEYCLKISLRGISSLDALPEREFREGLARLEAHCLEHETGETVHEDIDLFVFRAG